MTRSIPKRSFLVLSATRWTWGWSVVYILFCPGGTSRKAKKCFFAQRLKKQTFSHQFWWVGRETGNKTIFLGLRIALPCCGYSLVMRFKWVPTTCVLWRNKPNYPLIISKYPPYLFHFLCAQRRLRSAWAWVAKVPRFLHADMIRRGGCPAWFESSLGA